MFVAEQSPKCKFGPDACDTRPIKAKEQHVSVDVWYRLQKMKIAINIRDSKYYLNIDHTIIFSYIYNKHRKLLFKNL